MEGAPITKGERVLSAAAEAFMRYGFARTTMADIAKGAGMSRPALYLLFPDKEAIFDSVIRRLDVEMLAKVRAATAHADGLRERLGTACVTWGTHPAELVKAHPDATDLFDLRFPAVRQAYANFGELVTAMIAEAAECSDIRATPAELAQTLIFGMRGLRDCCEDLPSLTRLIELQVDLLVRALQRLD
jgi:AcrR family transcriptional regulator